MASEFLAVDPGYVCGIVQDGVGYRDGKPVITLHMEAYLGAPESFDAVEITGSPALKMKIAGGVHGDIATASITVNSIPKILEVAPGPAHHARHAAAVVLRRACASKDAENASCMPMADVESAGSPAIDASAMSRSTGLFSGLPVSCHQHA